MRAGWAEAPQAEPDEGPNVPVLGRASLTTSAVLVLSPCEQYQPTSKGTLLLLPSTARLAKSRRPRLVVGAGLMNGRTSQIPELHRRGLSPADLTTDRQKDFRSTSLRKPQLHIALSGAVLLNSPQLEFNSTPMGTIVIKPGNCHWVPSSGHTCRLHFLVYNYLHPPLPPSD